MARASTKLIWPLCEQREDSVRVAADAAAGGSDVGCPGESMHADGEVAHGRHDGGPVAGADLAVVLGEDDVADPMQPVLDVPVPADYLGELVGADVVEAQVGDRVDGLGVPPSGASRSAAAGELDRQAGMRESDPGADRGEFQRPGLASAVGGLAGQSTAGTCPQGSVASWRCRPGWLPLTVST
jgi:hypothetical protein